MNRPTIDYAGTAGLRSSLPMEPCVHVSAIVLHSVTIFLNLCASPYDLPLNISAEGYLIT